MKIEIVNKRNYDVNDKLRDVIAKKVSKFDKYFDDDTAVKVLLKSEGDKCNMEITALQGKAFMRAEATADNMYDAIDIVLPKLERQLRKHKTRLEKSLKQNAFKEEAKFYSEADLAESMKISKVKEFELEPMTEEDAIFQLDISGREFFVFLDSASNVMKILYKRYDGDYGIIIPKTV